MKIKAQNHLALVLKTKRNGEADLLITLLSAHKGKFTVVAKGVCSGKSCRKAYLQAGNLVQAQLVIGKGFDILTQTKLISDTGLVRSNFGRIKKLLLFLEIIDHLFYEEELNEDLWREVLYLRELLVKGLSLKLVNQSFIKILRNLGYLGEKEINSSISSLVKQITGTNLLTYEYLRLEGG